MSAESPESRRARADLIMLERDRLLSEARRGTVTLDRLQAINAELNVLVESLRELRREQLLEQLLEQVDPPKEPRRGWLSRLWRGRGRP